MQLEDVSKFNLHNKSVLKFLKGNDLKKVPKSVYHVLQSCSVPGTFSCHPEPEDGDIAMGVVVFAPYFFNAARALVITDNPEETYEAFLGIDNYFIKTECLTPQQADLLRPVCLGILEDERDAERHFNADLVIARQFQSYFPTDAVELVVAKNQADKKSIREHFKSCLVLFIDKKDALFVFSK
jgi:hypothetical protein